MQKKKTIKYLPYIVLTVSLLATLISWQFSVKSTENYSQTQLLRATLSLEDLISDRLTSVGNLLQGSSGLFAASEEVTRDEWKKFVEALNVHDRALGLQGVGFSEHFLPAEKAVIESKVRNDGYPEFRIFPENDQSEYTSIIYLEPLDERNLRAFGFDMFTEANRRAAMEYARDSGKLGMTKRITLLQEAEDNPQPGILVYLAVYRDGVVPATIEERRAQLEGYVYTPIRVKDLIESINIKKSPDLEFQIFDGSNQGAFVEENLLYGSSSDLLQPGYVGWYSETREIEFGGNTWTIRYATNSGYGLNPVQKIAPYIILLLGISLSLFLMQLVRSSLITHRKFLTAGVSEQDNQANVESRVLEEEALVSQDDRLIIATNRHGVITVFNKRAEQVLGYTESELMGVANFIDFVSEEQIKILAAEITKRTGIKTHPGFDCLVMDSLVEGQDSKNIDLIAKSEKEISVKIDIKALYSEKDELLGYRFTS